MAQATSSTYTMTAPTLVGVWLHSVQDAEGTVHNFIYGNIGRTETIGVQSSALKYIGRTYPVYDTGGFEAQSLKLDFQIPSGSDEQDQVQWFRDQVRSRRTLCYRDSRGRKHYVIIDSADITDERFGTSVSVTAITVDYNEEI